ncbi:MAG: bifunctional serine/threonine-protein kinase/formylglycine-generating enzyme family protein [Myxococcota bacterium]
MLRPDDRRLAAYLVESDSVPLVGLLAAIDDASKTGDLGRSLIARDLLGHEEIARIRREVERLRSLDLEAGAGKTLISDVGALSGATTPRELYAPRTVPEAAHGRATRPVNIEAADLRITPRVQLEPATRPSAPLDGPGGGAAEDRYALFGEIGRGGMGRILRGKDGLIGREVAVKVMLESKHASDIDIRRFWMEVQATGQLEHPAIIPIHDVGRLPTGELYYVMKLLGGRSLAEIIYGLRRGVTEVIEEFTRTRLLTVFQQLAYAVAFAHARGVIHRDIKPANIMIGRYGEVTLIDWGLAKITGDGAGFEPEEPRVSIGAHASARETADGTITGTPQYMSPEAVEGRSERVDERSDVYGLGAVLYEILTLEPPFEDRGFVQTLVDVRSGIFDPPRKRAPDRGVTADLEDLCLLAMHVDAVQRPTAKQLADDIGTILEGTKERERRAAEARSRVREGRAALDRWRLLKEELNGLEAQVVRQTKQVPPWAPVTEKAPLWDLEDRISRIRVEAVGAFEEAEAGFLRALGELPEDREARGLLAALYYDRFTEAEKNHDIEGQRYYRSLVSRYDDGAWARVLAGRGTLSIEVTRPAVEVRIARLIPRQRLLVKDEERSLGLAPIVGEELAIGSYLLSLVPPRGEPILRPVYVGRMEDVQVKLRWRDEEEIGEGFVYVPGGPCVIGGDPVAHGSVERRIVDVPDFAIARFPVTCADYMEFLNALAREDPAAALRRAPRVKANEGHYWRYNAERARFEFPPSQDGRISWAPNFPVVAVSYDDALTYLGWASKRSGAKLRLPREDEWEKAARGVDARFFPWGDHFDPTFCKMKDSRNSALEMEEVGAFAADCSPYGVRDLAGGVRELCLSIEPEHEGPVMRGGCWHDSGLFCRIAFRHPTSHGFVNTGLGFRVVKDLAEP